MRLIRIPTRLVNGRFYIAKSQSRAFSKWVTLDEAFGCLGRMVLLNPTQFNEVLGIVLVDKDGRTMAIDRRTSAQWDSLLVSKGITEKYGR